MPDCSSMTCLVSCGRRCFHQTRRRSCQRIRRLRPATTWCPTTPVGQRRAARPSGASTTWTSCMTCAWARTPQPPRGRGLVSDWGCDRVRFYKIDLSAPGGPLVDITARRRPAGFPGCAMSSRRRCSRRAPGRWRDNPVDDQNTVYGLTAVQGENQSLRDPARAGAGPPAPGRAGSGGKLTYQTTRTFCSGPRSS